MYYYKKLDSEGNLRGLKSSSCEQPTSDTIVELTLEEAQEAQAQLDAARQPTPEQIAAQERGALIQAKMREMAEAALIVEGVLAA